MWVFHSSRSSITRLHREPAWLMSDEDEVLSCWNLKLHLHCHIECEDRELYPAERAEKSLKRTSKHSLKLAVSVGVAENGDLMGELGFVPEVQCVGPLDPES